MPFDANLVLCDLTADWSHVNLVTSNTYGTPTSTTRNDGGFVVLDMGSAKIGTAVSGLAVVLVFTEAAADDADELYATIEESTEATFGSGTVHELGELDIAAAARGRILGSEVTSAKVAIGVVVVRRFVMERRYLRLKAITTNVADDFGKVWALVSPYPFRVL